MPSVLDEMDTLAVLRGIIAAAEDRFTFDLRNSDIAVPVGLLMRAADEIARSRDKLPTADTIPAEGRHDAESAAEPHETDTARGAGDPQTRGIGNPAEGHSAPVQ